MIKQKKTLFYFLLTIFAITFFSGCFGKKVNKTFSIEAEKAEAALLAATEHLLKLPKDADFATRSKYRSKFESALAEYLLASRNKQPTVLSLQRGGEKLLLPIEIVTNEDLDNKSNRNFATRSDTLLTNIHGQLLDMHLFEFQKRTYLTALFAKSLQIYLVENDELTLNHSLRFSNTVLKPITTSQSSGVLKTNIEQANIQFDYLTSDLDSAQTTFLYENKLYSGTAKNSIDNFSPAAWQIASGKNEFRSKNSDMIQPVVAIRELNTNYIVSINAKGFLQLQNRNFANVWVSSQPIGNRIFVIDSTEIAVLNTFENTFSIWENVNNELILKGVTAKNLSKIQTILPYSFNDEFGYLLSIEDFSGAFSNQLSFIFYSQNSILWQANNRIPAVPFPDESAEITFVSDSKTAPLPKQFFGNVFETLFNYDVDHSLQPTLTTSVTSNDFQNWEIVLKTNVRFSNSDLLTARDVINCWLKNMKNTSDLDLWIWQNFMGSDSFITQETSDVSGIFAGNDSTIIIKLNNPDEYFLHFLTLPEFAISKQLNENQNIGTGAFKIVSKNSRKTVLERNTWHHLGLPNISQITLRFTNESIVTESLGFERNAIFRAKKDVEFFSRAYENNIVKLLNPKQYFLQLNTKSFSLNQRIQLLERIAAQEYANIIEYGIAQPTSSIISKANFLDVLNATEKNVITKPISIIFKKNDVVSAEIAERIFIQFKQNAISVNLPIALSESAFYNRCYTKKYDLAIDFLQQPFEKSAANLEYLTKRNHIDFGDIFSDSLNTNEFSPEQIEQHLAKNGILHPLVKVSTYVAYPNQPNNIFYLPNGQLLLSKAWLQRKSDSE